MLNHASSLRLSLLSLVVVAGAGLLGACAASAPKEAHPGQVAYSVETDNLEIFLLDSQQNKTLNLTNHIASDWWPSWSPDGKQMAFVSDRADNLEIYVLDIAAETVTRLTYDDKDDVWPAWSPDGKSILFASNRDGNYDLYTIQPDGSGLTRLAATPNDEGLPGWSPDGKKIVYTLKSGTNSEVYIANRDLSDPLNISLQESAEDINPAWSPDGEWIAYESDRDDNPEIYLYHVKTGETKNLTSNPTRDEYPAWLPDGRLSFTSNPGERWDLFTMTLDRQNVTNLTNNEEIEWRPSWRP